MLQASRRRAPRVTRRIVTQPSPNGTMVSHSSTSTKGSSPDVDTMAAVPLPVFDLVGGQSSSMATEPPFCLSLRRILAAPFSPDMGAWKRVEEWLREKAAGDEHFIAQEADLVDALGWHPAVTPRVWAMFVRSRQWSLHGFDAAIARARGDGECAEASLGCIPLDKIDDDRLLHLIKIKGFCSTASIHQLILRGFHDDAAVAIASPHAASLRPADWCFLVQQWSAVAVGSTAFAHTSQIRLLCSSLEKHHHNIEYERRRQYLLCQIMRVAASHVEYYSQLMHLVSSIPDCFPPPSTAVVGVVLCRFFALRRAHQQADTSPSEASLRQLIQAFQQKGSSVFAISGALLASAPQASIPALVQLLTMLHGETPQKEADTAHTECPLCGLNSCGCATDSSRVNALASAMNQSDSEPDRKHLLCVWFDLGSALFSGAEVDDALQDSGETLDSFVTLGSMSVGRRCQRCSQRLCPSGARVSQSDMCLFCGAVQRGVVERIVECIATTSSAAECAELRTECDALSIDSRASCDAEATQCAAPMCEAYLWGSVICPSCNTLQHVPFADTARWSRMLCAAACAIGRSEWNAELLIRFIVVLRSEIEEVLKNKHSPVQPREAFAFLHRDPCVGMVRYIILRVAQLVERSKASCVATANGDRQVAVHALARLALDLIELMNATVLDGDMIGFNVLLRLRMALHATHGQDVRDLRILYLVQMRLTRVDLVGPERCAQCVFPLHDDRCPRCASRREMSLTQQLNARGLQTHIASVRPSPPKKWLVDL